MVFLDSPSLIQSEAVLIHTEPGGDRKEGDGAAQARCENGEELLGDLPGVSGPDAKRSHSGDLEWGRSGEEKVESNHQKKTRRNGDELGSVSSGALEEASDKPLGGGERDHRKRARRRRGGSSERLGSGGELRASEANALGEGLRFCGGAESVDRLTSEENGGRGEMVAGPEAESREDATCPEGADGVHTSGEAGDREERRVSCTANAGGEYSDSTWASLADIRNGAIDPLRGPEGNHRGIGVSPGVDFSYLASDYLQAMVAGLAFLGPVIEERTEARGLLDVLVIGLGGGGMPMFLRRHLPCRVEVRGGVIVFEEGWFLIVIFRAHSVYSA